MSNVHQIKYYVIREGMDDSEIGDPLNTENFDFIHPLSPEHNGTTYGQSSSNQITYDQCR